MLFSILKDFVSRAVSTRQVSDMRVANRAQVSVNEAAAVVPNLIYRRGGCIVAFVGDSQGDALKEHTLEMTKPLRAHAEDVVIIDFRNATWGKEFEAVARKPIWFAVSPFGGGELFADDSGGTLSPWARAGIPFVRLYGDLPAYFPARHIQHLPNSINAYGHDEHHAFYSRWFKPTAPSVWLPFFPFDTIPASSVRVAEKVRGGLIVFPKNGNSPEALVTYWRNRLPQGIAAQLEAVAEEAVSRIDSSIDLADAVKRQFARLGIDLSGHRHLLFFLVAQLDDYLRRIKSTMIAQALLDLPVTIRGVNWEHVDFHGRRARHDGNSDYASTRELLDRSIAVVDMSPNTEHGPHDRVLRATGRYTAFLTNQSRFYSENFDNADEFTFSFNPEAIRERVEHALSSPTSFVDVGLAQGSKMRELLTQEHYVEQVIAAVDACAMGCGTRPEGTQNYVAFEPIS